jgi:hypothetical protein
MAVTKLKREKIMLIMDNKKYDKYKKELNELKHISSQDTQLSKSDNIYVIVANSRAINFKEIKDYFEVSTLLKETFGNVDKFIHHQESWNLMVKYNPRKMELNGRKVSGQIIDLIRN